MNRNWNIVAVSVAARQDNTTDNHKTYKVSGFDLCNFNAPIALDNNKKARIHKLHDILLLQLLQLKQSGAVNILK